MLFPQRKVTDYPDWHKTPLNDVILAAAAEIKECEQPAFLDQIADFFSCVDDYDPGRFRTARRKGGSWFFAGTSVVFLSLYPKHVNRFVQGLSAPEQGLAALSHLLDYACAYRFLGDDKYAKLQLCMAGLRGEPIHVEAAPESWLTAVVESDGDPAEALFATLFTAAMFNHDWRSVQDFCQTLVNSPLGTTALPTGG